MGYYDDIFSVLGIKPTKNVDKIKRAYASKTRKYHTESEEWQEVRYAYKRAMDYAGRPEEPRVIYREAATPQKTVISKPQSGQQQKAEVPKKRPERTQKWPDTDKHKGKKFNWIGSLVTIVLIIGSFLLEMDDFSFSWISDLFGNKMISEKQAETEILLYLEQKYPEMEIIAEDIHIQTREIYDFEKDRDVKCAYYANFYRTDSKVYLFSEKGEEGDRIFCFDDLQKEEITSAFATYLLDETGLDEGMVCLGAGDNDWSQVFFYEGAFFHERYEGELDGMIQAEMQYRENLQGILPIDNAGQVEAYADEELLRKGVCVLYYRDAEVMTIADRLNKPMPEANEEIPPVLEEAAKKWQMQIECIGFPAAYYDKIQDASEEERFSIEYALENLPKSGPYQSEVPVMAHMVTSWYKTGTEKMDGKMVIPEVNEIMEGVYVIGMTDMLLKDIERLQVKEIEMPHIMEEYLEKAAGYQKTFSLEYYLDEYEEERQYCTIVFDKEKLGIKGSEYMIGITPWKTDSTEDLWEIEPTTDLSAAISTYSSNACEFGSYVSVKVSVNEKETADVITIIQ